MDTDVVLYQVLLPIVYISMYPLFWKYRSLPPCSEVNSTFSLVVSVGGGIVMYVSEFDRNCLVLTATLAFYIPTVFFPIFLMVKELLLKFRFEEAMTIKDHAERLATLQKLQREKSTKALIIWLLIALVPHIFVFILHVVVQEQAHDLSDTSYDYKEVCNGTVLGHFVNLGVLIPYFVLGYFGYKKLTHANDQWGIQLSLRSLFRMELLSLMIFLLFGKYTGRTHSRIFQFYLQYWLILRPALQARQHLKKSMRLTADEAGLIDILRDTDGFQAFLAHIQSEFSSENLMFWSRVETFKKQQGGGAETDARELVEEFIAGTAVLQVNLSSDVRVRLEEAVGQGAFSADMFDEAQAEVFHVMALDAFMRFKRGPHYAAFKGLIEDREKRTNSLMRPFPGGGSRLPSFGGSNSVVPVSPTRPNALSSSPSGSLHQ